VFVGSFDVETITPLLARYLGALPSTGKAASRFEDRGVKFPETVKKTEIRKGREPRSTTTAHLLRRRREQRDGSPAGLDRGGRAAQPAAGPAAARRCPAPTASPSTTRQSNRVERARAQVLIVLGPFSFRLPGSDARGG